MQIALSAFDLRLLESVFITKVYGFSNVILSETKQKIPGIHEAYFKIF